MMVFSIYSPNMLKTYEQCPRKFFYRYISNLNVPASSLPFEKGKKIHALANYFLKGVNISRIETALAPAEAEIWHTLLDNPFFQKDCLQSEYQLSCKIGEFWIGGRLDAVVHDYEQYYILDYKTGSVPKNPEYDYQTMIYLLSMDKLLNGKYESLSFVYINLKEKNNYVIEFNDKLRLDYQERIINICDKINTDTIYHGISSNCKSCEFVNICDSSCVI